MFYVIIIIMRIDKLLCEMNICSRSEAKLLIKKGQIFADDVKITRPEHKVDEQKVVIQYKGKEYRYRPFVYYMLNKPSGVVSATYDANDKTVIDLLTEHLKKCNGGELAGIPVKDMFPVGRLDKDTVGLLLLTNDGELSHKLLSPKKHIPKTYYVETDLLLSEEKRLALEQGVDIGEEKLTKKANVCICGERKYHITITEGKFHQVKRMFAAVGLQVLYLKRLSMGNLVLDETLSEGEIRELTQEEVLKLC